MGLRDYIDIIDYFMILAVEFNATYQVAQKLLIAVQHKNTLTYQKITLNKTIKFFANKPKFKNTKNNYIQHYNG